MTEAYAITHFMPGYTIVGLKGWDDFIVKDTNSHLHAVSTIPLEARHLRRLDISIDPCSLIPDEKLKNKIKWYVKPVIFGGDPNIGENMTWISVQDHIAAVKYWNQL